MTNWKDIDYLRTGSPRQQLAYSALQNLNVLSTLREFDPVLVGTIPLEIAIASSDLDVLCAVAPGQVADFRELLQRHYAHLPTFALAQKLIAERECVVCRFQYQGFIVEVFGQDYPTEAQHGFRHMVIEDRVLQVGGETWRTAVRRLKEQGLKTEPAFAALLQLPGNPYEALLELEGKSISELQRWLAGLPPPAADEAT